MGVEHTCEAQLEGGILCADVLLTSEAVGKVLHLAAKRAVGVARFLGDRSGGPSDDAGACCDTWDDMVGRRCMVVEVDGPAHCAADEPAMVVGRTLLRNTLLHALGWQVRSAMMCHDRLL